MFVLDVLTLAALGWNTCKEEDGYKQRIDQRRDVAVECIRQVESEQNLHGSKCQRQPTG